MNKVITGLILVWLTVLTAFGCYTLKAEHELLKFADFVLDDNLKNVIQSGGTIFYIVDMDMYAKAHLLTDVPLWQPVYVKDSDMEHLAAWKRKYTLMVRDFNNLNFKSKLTAAQADRYFKNRVIGMYDRKKTYKERIKEADQEKRNRE